MGMKSPDSHKPLLIKIGEIFGDKIRKSVELGSGLYSTPLFLDRKYFPNMEIFISYESDVKWFKIVSESIKDKRFDFRFYQNYNEIDITLSGDLLFVDGIKKHRKQILTDMHNNFDLVVCHDTDLKWFTDEEKSYFKYFWEYKPKGRHTGIMSNFIDIELVNWDLQNNYNEL